MKLLAPLSALTTAALVQKARAALPADVAALIDDSADPCEDFYQYACGAWVAATEIPEDETSVYYSFSGIQDRNDVVVKEILQEGWPLLGELWDSCMDVDALNELGNAPLQAALDQIQAVETAEELFKLYGELFWTGTVAISTLLVSDDIKNASVNVLYVIPSDLTLPDMSYYADSDTFAGLEPAFRTYISTILTLSGYASDCDSTTLEDAVLNIELGLVNLTQSVGEDIDPSDLFAYYKPISYSEAVEAYPWTFGAFVEGLGLLDSAPGLAEDTNVIFPSLEYYDALEDWLDTLDLEDLKTYFAFSYVHLNVKYLSEDFYQAYFEMFPKTLMGQQVESSREDICQSRARDALPDLVGKHFASKMFDEKSQEDTELMLELVEDAMANRLEEIEWLDDVTFDAAETKLEKVANFIGYEDQNETYPFSLSPTDFFGNLETAKIHQTAVELSNIGLPTVRGAVDVQADEANAFYYPNKNAMIFPVGILQAPMYNASVHPARNFGAIGTIIGHELTHGFDSNGRNFDGDGNKKDWWSAETSDAFDSHAQCLANQYSNFEVIGEDGSLIGNVDGNLTLGENIADNGGLRLSYEAYHAYMNESSSDVPESSDLTSDEAEKLFFLSYAHAFCETLRDATAQLALTDEHSPGRWRVNGAAMNNDDFARVFQCSAGSTMNPTDKCVVW